MQCSRCEWNMVGSLTFDDQGEVAVIESRVLDGNAPLVEAIVDPLAGPGGHVEDSLHRILWAAAHQVPVHHPLTVLQSVLGPHHAGAVAGQNGPGPCRESDVHGLHHHTERAAAAALTPCWHAQRKKHIGSVQQWQQKQQQKDVHQTCLTSWQEESSNNWNRRKQTTSDWNRIEELISLSLRYRRNQRGHWLSRGKYVWGSLWPFEFGFDLQWPDSERFQLWNSCWFSERSVYNNRGKLMKQGPSERFLKTERFHTGAQQQKQYTRRQLHTLEIYICRLCFFTQQIGHFALACLLFLCISSHSAISWSVYWRADGDACGQSSQSLYSSGLPLAGGKATTPKNRAAFQLPAVTPNTCRFYCPGNYKGWRGGAFSEGGVVWMI